MKKIIIFLIVKWKLCLCIGCKGPFAVCGSIANYHVLEMSGMKRYDIKVIGLDLDGTVFDDRKNISPRTIAAIQAAAQKGVAVLPATGRFLVGLPQSFVGLPGVQYALTSNGAVVTELATGKRLVSQMLPDDTAAEIMRILAGFSCAANAFIDDCGYASSAVYAQLNEWYGNTGLESYVRSFLHPELSPLGIVQTHLGHVEKISGIFHSVEERNRAAAALSALPCEVCSSFPNNIEISAKGVDKGEGLLQLARVLGWGPENVMACGDSSNDLAMIQKAGLGVAMGNASEDVKQAADYITLTNNEDGVAAAIEKFVL